MWRDVDDLVAELLLDQTYWARSGGGVTISGGEASIQVDALRSLLAKLRVKGVHTVLQTNGNMSWENLEKIARHVNLFQFDLKGIDDDKHRLNAGVGNERILTNAKRLSSEGYPVVFRVPLVPGHNDSLDDLLRLRNFFERIEACVVDVLPYHNLGERKLDLIGVEEGRLSLPSLSWMEAVNKARLLESKTYVVTVSGEDLPKNTPERNPQPNLQPL
jgi:pyruvate formate lyase activating enzyme